MRVPRLLAAAASIVGIGALAAAGLGAAPAAANPTGTNVVINEVYAVGGSAGAPYTNKFVELYNPTAAPIAIDGWSLQYRPAGGTGNASGVAALSGSIAAGGYYLIQLGSNGTVGAALPTPDASAGLNPSGSNGTLWLASGNTAINPGTGDLAGSGAVVDLVGYGSSNTFEGTAAGGLGVTSDQRSTQRTNGVDTDVNSADFSRAAPTPQNSASTPVSTPPATTSAPSASLHTISEIQGAGAATPFDGQTVSVEGIVTAVYATGGLGGFNLEQADGTPVVAGASKGVFVYSPTFAQQVKIGDSVRVTGTAGEYFGSTQLTATAVEPLANSLGTVTPAQLAWPEGDAAREAVEHQLILPTGAIQVADNYKLNQYGEILLATGTAPLVTPTEVGAPGSAAAIAQEAYNVAHAVILDDGATTNYTRVVGGQMVNAGIPLPYLTLDTPVTVGAPVTFTKPVVVHYSFNEFRFDPTTPLTGANPQDAPATFADVRTAAPESVGGTLTLGTFNVLNYFTDLGVDHCTAGQNYQDRDGNPITANGCLPRGAWDQANLDRQQAKIVAAINAMDADVISLEEIEDSSDFGAPRDASLAALVEALNSAAGTATWDYVRSPATVPTSGNDVIRTAFIYQPASVGVVGESVILDDANFVNARAPLSQAFVDRASGEEFLVIVNHFKSKGGSGTGDNENLDKSVTADLKVGGWNGDRTRQAQALVAFATAEQARAGTDKVFLTGDFNSYSQETPVTTITGAGYANLSSTKAEEYSYVFSGRVGSLDHIFASPAAAALVTGADVWTINAYESVALEYSRYNSNITPLYAPDPYRSSDHNPEIVGVNFAPVATTPPATTTPPAAPAVPTIDAPATISDAELMTPGLPVSGTGFTPGTPVTVTIITATGDRMAVPFDDASVLVPGADGTLSLRLTASGLVPAGTYTVEVTQGSSIVRDTVVVTASATSTTPLPTSGTPPITGGGLAETGAADLGPMAIAAVMLLLAGTATLALRRRRAA